MSEPSVHVFVEGEGPMPVRALLQVLDEIDLMPLPPADRFRIEQAIRGFGLDTWTGARVYDAGPDLLAALRDIMSGQIGHGVDHSAPRFHAARTAIARAEGRTP